jgi:hypothetical protein
VFWQIVRAAEVGQASAALKHNSASIVCSTTPALLASADAAVMSHVLA